MIECMIKSNNSVTRFQARTWLDFLQKIDQIIRSEKITFPIGEDENIEMVTKEVKETDKFN